MRRSHLLDFPIRQHYRNNRARKVVAENGGGLRNITKFGKTYVSLKSNCCGSLFLKRKIVPESGNNLQYRYKYFGVLTIREREAVASSFRALSRHSIGRESMQNEKAAALIVKAIVLTIFQLEAFHIPVQNVYEREVSEHF